MGVDIARQGEDQTVIRASGANPGRHLAVHYGPVPDVDFRLGLLVLVIRSYGSLRLRL